MIIEYIKEFNFLTGMHMVQVQRCVRMIGGE